ncbi:MAG: hypothetical protein HQK96_15675 [Nitrospirae bacterium]|nr:hypothetical protein [Nitrospirota bacterium]
MEVSLAKIFVEGLFKIVPLVEFRNTLSVKFHMLPRNKIPCIDSIDRVEHGPNSISPTIKWDARRFITALLADSVKSN